MASGIEDDLAELESGKTIKFTRLATIAGRHFEHRQGKGSHQIFKTPWQGDPRINLQKSKSSDAKKYQVQQVVEALRKLLETEEAKRKAQEKPKPK